VKTFLFCLVFVSMNQEPAMCHSVSVVFSSYKLQLIILQYIVTPFIPSDNQLTC